MMEASYENEDEVEEEEEFIDLGDDIQPFSMSIKPSPIIIPQ